MSGPVDCDDLEQLYVSALSRPEVVKATLDWGARADAARGRLRPVQIAYGPHGRERLDLFHADRPRGALVYVHGGYFKGRAKEDFSWVAEGYVAEGISVAVLSFPLCPEATISAMTDSVARALTALWRQHWSEEERSRVLLVGHSSGAYLAAAQQTRSWAWSETGRPPFHGALLISGVFDLAPLTQTSLNAVLGLSPSEARALDLRVAPRVSAVPTKVAVGASEPAVFRRQAEDLCDAWSGAPAPACVEVPGRAHFDILNTLVTPSGELKAAAMALLARDACPQEAAS